MHVHAHAKVVVKSWFRYGRVLFNFPYSNFFAATSLTGTFYRTARSLVVRAQMMVHGMSSCSSCSAWCRAGRGWPKFKWGAARDNHACMVDTHVRAPQVYTYGPLSIKYDICGYLDVIIDQPCLVVFSI